jgi:predicted GNAT family acetyltransferase
LCPTREVTARRAEYPQDGVSSERDRNERRAAREVVVTDGSHPKDLVRVSDNPARRRYEGFVDDTMVGFVTYRLAPGRVIFVHAEVDPDLEDRGIGGALARGALDDARARGLGVVPMCPFIARYIKDHPEYSDLVGGS